MGDDIKVEIHGADGTSDALSEDDIAVMQRVRAAVDPAALANRGKMLAPPAGLEPAGVVRIFSKAH